VAEARGDIRQADDSRWVDDDGWDLSMLALHPWNVRAVDFGQTAAHRSDDGYWSKVRVSCIAVFGMGSRRTQLTVKQVACIPYCSWLALGLVEGLSWARLRPVVV